MFILTTYVVHHYMGNIFADSFEAALSLCWYTRRRKRSKFPFQKRGTSQHHEVFVGSYSRLIDSTFLSAQHSDEKAKGNRKLDETHSNADKIRKRKITTGTSCVCVRGRFFFLLLEERGRITLERYRVAAGICGQRQKKKKDKKKKTCTCIYLMARNTPEEMLRDSGSQNVHKKNQKIYTISKCICNTTAMSI